MTAIVLAVILTNILQTDPCEYYTQRKAALADREVAYVTLEIEGMGDIKLALDATAAPITVRHFLRLVDEGFYDGLTFYTAQEEFALQAGCPNFNSTGLYKDENKNAVCIEGEFASNGYKGNDILHKRGVISMLRWSQNDSASCQFFICNTDIEDLDGYFAPFGYVTDGMDVVDKITATSEFIGSDGLVEREKQAVIKKATIDDLGGIDINKEIYLKDGVCEYVEARDISGRDVVYVDITVKHFGTVKVLLDRTTAPITVDNFVKLVNEKFYDGLTFHRVMESFMIQGGDPKADGTGGSSETIKGEFESNGYKDNDISHIRGVISMARSDDKDSASSQFFICNTDSTFLDGNYAAFGYVVEGLRVIDDITRATAIYGEVPAKANQAIIESIRIVEN